MRQDKRVARRAEAESKMTSKTKAKRAAAAAKPLTKLKTAKVIKPSTRKENLAIAERSGWDMNNFELHVFGMLHRTLRYGELLNHLLKRLRAFGVHDKESKELFLASNKIVPQQGGTAMICLDKDQYQAESNHRKRLRTHASRLHELSSRIDVLPMDSDRGKDYVYKGVHVEKGNVLSSFQMFLKKDHKQSDIRSFYAHLRHHTPENKFMLSRKKTAAVEIAARKYGTDLRKFGVMPDVVEVPIQDLREYERQGKTTMFWRDWEGNKRFDIFDQDDIVRDAPKPKKEKQKPGKRIQARTDKASLKAQGAHGEVTGSDDVYDVTPNWLRVAVGETAEDAIQSWEDLKDSLSLGPTDCPAMPEWRGHMLLDGDERREWFDGEGYDAEWVSDTASLEDLMSRHETYWELDAPVVDDSVTQASGTQAQMNGLNGEATNTDDVKGGNKSKSKKIEREAKATEGKSASQGPPPSYQQKTTDVNHTQQATAAVSALTPASVVNAAQPVAAKKELLVEPVTSGSFTYYSHACNANTWDKDSRVIRKSRILQTLVIFLLFIATSGLTSGMLVLSSETIYHRYKRSIQIGWMDIAICVFSGLALVVETWWTYRRLLASAMYVVNLPRGKRVVVSWSDTIMAPRVDDIRLFSQREEKLIVDAQTSQVIVETRFFQWLHEDSTEFFRDDMHIESVYTEGRNHYCACTLTEKYLVQRHLAHASFKCPPRRDAKNDCISASVVALDRNCSVNLSQDELFIKMQTCRYIEHLIEYACYNLPF